MAVHRAPLKSNFTLKNDFLGSFYQKIHTSMHNVLKICEIMDFDPFGGLKPLEGVVLEQSVTS